MASSLALIPWNQPDANQAVATIHGNSRPNGGRWALVLKAILSPSPGRTLDRMYTSLGDILERQANRAAYTLGHGPHVVANKIKVYFGNSEERVQRLELLRSSVPPKLEKKCLKLMKYTQPTESADTQCRAFKDVVHLVTLFPGLRVIFLRAKFLEGQTSVDAITALYNRDFVAINAEWEFWRTFAAGCLSDSDIGAMLEERRICELAICDEGLSLVERLLIESNSSLCYEMFRMLNDMGVDILTLGSMDESEPQFDYEGIDLLATVILDGLSTWCSTLDRGDWALQAWWNNYRQFVQLLRMPRAAELLPQSSGRAASIQDLLPTSYQDAKLNVTVDGENIKGTAPHTRHDTPLADLHCRNNSTTSVHTKISDQDDAQDLDSDLKDCGDAHSTDSGVPSENGTHVLSAPEKEGYDSETQFDDAQDVQDFECKKDISQGSNWNGNSNRADSDMTRIAGPERLENSIPHPSLEVWRREAEDRKIILHQLQLELGEDRPETLEAMENLASTQYKLGDYRSARDFKLRVVVLEKRRIVLGEDHPDTVTTMENLGTTYERLGDFKHAESLLIQVLEKRREVQGEENPQTLWTMGKLASTYRNLGRFKEAEKLQVQVLKKQREAVGEDHPDTLDTMSNLANACCQSGQLNEAEILLIQVLKTRKEILGEAHPDTLRTMGYLGVTYLDSGRLHAAEELLVAAVGKQRTVLGEDHPDTLRTMGNLVWTYHSQGQFERAQELGVVVLKKKKRQILGDDHPSTKWTMRSLVTAYRSLNKVLDAEELEALLGGWTPNVDTSGIDLP
ncbi:hypothetical protein MVEN_02243100 [Mycena venus]|uniref:Kinesin light chain n=1 Tax=Mycena venus TaxID=2733690 RepID=A0A8H6X659_9AGAR|nr:hypothetical protein MVEN_02243100 [Mycena venus]